LEVAARTAVPAVPGATGAAPAASRAVSDRKSPL
jgi:hypothetical protein